MDIVSGIFIAYSSALGAFIVISLYKDIKDYIIEKYCSY